MPNFSIKEVPEAWAEALRQRAARNHRSLQGELMAIIEQAAHASLSDATDAPAVAPSARLQRGWKTIEQIATERRQRFPQPVTGVPLAVDILRAARDVR